MRDRVSSFARDETVIVRRSTSPHAFFFFAGHIILSLIYMLASHWLVRAACIWLPWKDALRAACEASLSNHGAGLAGDSMV